MSHRLFYAPALALCALATPSAADAQLDRSGGLIGQSVTYDLDGDPGEIFLLLPSFTTGPTPLAVLEPGDPRVLAVGIDLLDFAAIGLLDGNGLGSVIYPLPNNPNLQGLVLNAQFVTINLVGPLFDEVSNATRFRLSQQGLPTFTVGNVLDSLDAHSSTLLDDGRVLLAGGVGLDVLGNPAPRDGFMLYDPNTESFSAAGGQMQHARAQHEAVKLADGRVLLIGGVDGTSSARNTVDIWDPTTQTVSAAASMGAARVVHTATLLADGRVFVSGGISGSFDINDIGTTITNALSSTLASSEVYNPGTNSWSAGPSFSNPRALHRATLLDNGQVLVTGGLQVITFIVSIPALTNDCQRYDPGSNSYVATANISGSRAAHGQVKLANGQVLVTGGISSFDVLAQTVASTTTCRRYDASTNTWTNVASLGTARGLHQLVSTGTGLVNLGGFSSADGMTATFNSALTIEVSSQAVIGWSSPSNMLLPRLNVISTTIEGGARVLSTGSGDNGQPSVADTTAEVFHP